MKSIKMFGKSVPLLAIVVISLLAIGASAALLTQYGTITGVATVSQSVLIDDDETSVSESFDIVAGGTECVLHSLVNKAEVEAGVDLLTGYSTNYVAGDIETSYYELLGFSYSQSTDATTISVEDLGCKVEWTITVDWDKVPYGASHAATALMIGDMDDNILYQVHNNDGVDPDYGVGTWLYSKYEDGWYTGGETANSIPVEDLLWVEASGGLETEGNILTITIDKSHLACDEFKWVLRVPQEFTNPDFGWGDTDMMNAHTATVGSVLSGAFTLAPGETMPLGICYVFNIALDPELGPYTITTTVDVA